MRPKKFPPPVWLHPCAAGRDPRKCRSADCRSLCRAAPPPPTNPRRPRARAARVRLPRVCGYPPQRHRRNFPSSSRRSHDKLHIRSYAVFRCRTAYAPLRGETAHRKARELNRRKPRPHSWALMRSHQILSGHCPHNMYGSSSRRNPRPAL